MLARPGYNRRSKIFQISVRVSCNTDTFNSRDGLKKSLNVLQSAPYVRSGGGNATPNPHIEVLTTSDEQISYQICIALKQYFRACLLLLVDTLSGRALSVSGRAVNKALDINDEAMDAVCLKIQMDGELSRKLLWAEWPAVYQFLESNGPITMLELCQVRLSAVFSEVLAGQNPPKFARIEHCEREMHKI